MDDVYTENDKFIGEMMKYLDEDTSIFVVSDHGVMPHSAGDEYAGIGTIGGFTTKVMSELGYTVTNLIEIQDKTVHKWCQQLLDEQRDLYVESGETAEFEDGISFTVD